MTVLLEKVVHEVESLPDSEQDAVASLILDELAAERRWNQAFARTQDQLAKLAGKARAQFHAGDTEELDLDTL